MTLSDMQYNNYNNIYNINYYNNIYTNYNNILYI